jgi:hypothetical protein
MHENRETSQTSRRRPAAGTGREGVSRDPERKAGEESDRGKVSMKSPNKAEAPAWEAAGVLGTFMLGICQGETEIPGPSDGRKWLRSRGQRFRTPLGRDR